MTRASWWVAWLAVAATVAVGTSASWGKGGGGGGGHGGGGGGGGHSSGAGGVSSYGGHYGTYGRTPGTPMTPEERARMLRTVAVVGGGTAVVGAGVGTVLWVRAGFDVVTLAFSLRRKRYYAQRIAGQVAATDFSQPAGRARLLSELASELRTEDLEGGYIGRLRLKLNATRAAGRATELAKRRESAADVDLHYVDGGHDTADGDRTAPDRDDDRCVLSIVATMPRTVSRMVAVTRPGSPLGEAAACEARSALDMLARRGASVDGLWVFCTPAPEEPLPSASARTLLTGLRQIDGDAAA